MTHTTIPYFGGSSGGGVPPPPILQTITHTSGRISRPTRRWLKRHDLPLRGNHLTTINHPVTIPITKDGYPLFSIKEQLLTKLYKVIHGFPSNRRRKYRSTAAANSRSYTAT